MAENLQRPIPELSLRFGVLYGVVMGVIWGTLSMPFLSFTGPFACIGVPLVALFAALLFGPTGGLIVGVLAKRINRPPETLEDGESLLVWTIGNVSGDGGVLALSDRRLWFVPGKLCDPGLAFSIPLPAIREAIGVDGWLAGNLYVRTDAALHALRLDFAPQWAERIADARTRGEHADPA